MKGSTIYEFGDFGGLLVLAYNQVPTQNIFFSVDGGLTLGVVSLNETVFVLNILATSARGERFIVIARDVLNQDSYKYWGIDFSGVFTRNCTDADYEEWTPGGGVRGPKCVLGHDITYIRRKQSATCYTQDDLNSMVNIQNCPCVADRDYECDYDFQKSIVTAVCLYQKKNLERDSELAQCTDKITIFNVSSGYRKVPGDTCSPSLPQYAPRQMPCNATQQNIMIEEGAHPGAVALLVLGIILLVLIGIVSGFCLGLRNERFRKRFPWIKAPSWVHAGYSNELVEDVVGDEFADDRDDDGVNVSLDPSSE